MKFLALAKAMALAAGIAGSHPACHATANTPFGVSVRNQPAFQIGGKVDCSPRNLYQFVRVCAEQKNGANWDLVQQPNPWGRCKDSGWIDTTWIDVEDQFFGTPGQEYRTLTEAWDNVGGKVQPVMLAVSKPFVCCDIGGGTPIVPVNG